MKLDDAMKLQHFVGILTAIHMCIILYFPWVFGPKSLSDAKPQAAWLKGGATMPRGAAGTRGQDPWGYVTSLSSHIKLWKAGFTDSGHVFYYSPTCSSQPQGLVGCVWRMGAEQLLDSSVLEHLGCPLVWLPWASLLWWGPQYPCSDTGIKLGLKWVHRKGCGQAELAAAWEEAQSSGVSGGCPGLDPG